MAKPSFKEKADVMKTDNTAKNSKPIQQNKSIDVLLRTIQQNKKLIENSLKSTIELLIELHSRQDELTKATGKTFKQYIKEDVQISTSAFYENLQAYQISPDLYQKANTKNLLIIAKEKNEETKEELLNILEENPELSAPEFKNAIKAVRPADSLKPPKKTESDRRTKIVNADYSIVDNAELQEVKDYCDDLYKKSWKIRERDDLPIDSKKKEKAKIELAMLMKVLEKITEIQDRNE